MNTVLLGIVFMSLVSNSTSSELQWAPVKSVMIKFEVLASDPNQQVSAYILT